MSVKFTSNWAHTEEEHRDAVVAEVLAPGRVKIGKMWHLTTESLDQLARETQLVLCTGEKVEGEMEPTLLNGYAQQKMPFSRKIAGGTETQRKNAIPFVAPVIDAESGLRKAFRDCIQLKKRPGVPDSHHIWSVSKNVRFIAVPVIGLYHEGHDVPVLYEALYIWMMNKLIGVDPVLEALEMDPSKYRCFPLDDTTFAVYPSDTRIKVNDAHVFLRSFVGVNSEKSAVARHFVALSEHQEFIDTCKALALDRVGDDPEVAYIDFLRKKPRRSAGDGSNSRQSAAGPSRAKREAK